jgi:predicted membrane-bound dolichyl-phosphate-mannose-protein mannosyltransferase
MTSFSTEPRQIRRFGIIAMCFFSVLCALFLWRHRMIVAPIAGVLAAIGMGFVLAPGPLKPVYCGWLKVAHCVGMVINTVALTTAYYLVMTPAALIKRMAGGRPLPLRPSKTASSYWVSRTEPAQPKERFCKRF